MAITALLGVVSDPEFLEQKPCGSLPHGICALEVCFPLPTRRSFPCGVGGWRGWGVQKPACAGSRCGWGWLCWSSLVRAVSRLQGAVRVSASRVPLSAQALPRTRRLLCEGPVFSAPVAAQTQCCPVTWSERDSSVCSTGAGTIAASLAATRTDLSLSRLWTSQYMHPERAQSRLPQPSCDSQRSSTQQGGLSSPRRVPRPELPICGSHGSLPGTSVYPGCLPLPLSSLPGVQVPRDGFSAPYLISCLFFLQPWLYRSPSACFQISSVKTIPPVDFLDVFVGKSELHVLLLCHLDTSPELCTCNRNNGLPGDASGKEPACQCRRCKRLGFDAWVQKIPWRRAQQPTPVFLPGEPHGQRSLVGYSPWGRTE